MDFKDRRENRKKAGMLLSVYLVVEASINIENQIAIMLHKLILIFLRVSGNDKQVNIKTLKSCYLKIIL